MTMNTARAKVPRPPHPDRRQLPRTDRERHPGPDAGAGRGALRERDDVQWVGARDPGCVPRYAERVLDTPKVSTVLTKDKQVPEGVEGADVAAPAVPAGRRPAVVNWRRAGRAGAWSPLQDLIAYGVGAYHVTPKDWISYRRASGAGVPPSDASVVISHDVREQTCAASGCRSWPSGRSSSRTAPTTSSGEEATSMPAELLARGWASRQFLVVLGANYSHKNRDLAIRMWRELRDRGHPSLGLVLAGVSVAEGSSRVLEAAATSDGGEERSDASPTSPPRSATGCSGTRRLSLPHLQRGFRARAVRGCALRNSHRFTRVRAARRGAAGRTRGGDLMAP